MQSTSHHCFASSNNHLSSCSTYSAEGLGRDDPAICMQAKVQELGGVSAEQTSQIATLREELQGSLAELDQVCSLRT